MSNVLFKYEGTNNILSDFSLHLDSENVSNLSGNNIWIDDKIKIIFNNEIVIQAGETKTLFIETEVGSSDQDETHQITLIEIVVDNETTHILNENIKS